MNRRSFVGATFGALAGVVGLGKVSATPLPPVTAAGKFYPDDWTDCGHTRMIRIGYGRVRGKALTKLRAKEEALAAQPAPAGFKCVDFTLTQAEGGYDWIAVYTKEVA